MTRIQLARDISMARTLTDLAQPGRVVVLQTLPDTPSARSGAVPIGNSQRRSPTGVSYP